MTSLPEHKPAEQSINEYLDRLSEQLHALPPQVQSETREEIRQHLQSLVAREHQPERVLQNALRQFGDPVEIGQRLALEWEAGEWDLSGLPLVQRIDKMRAAIEAENEQHSKHPRQHESTRLRIVKWLWVGLIPLVVCTGFARGGAISTPYVSGVNLNVAAIVLWGLLIVAGIVASILEWREAAGQPQATNRALRAIWGRAFMTIFVAFIPGPVSPPWNGAPWTWIFIAAMLMLTVAQMLVDEIIRRREPSARARLASGFWSGYSAVHFAVLFPFSLLCIYLGLSVWWILSVAIVLSLLPFWSFKKHQETPANKS